jgi:hypothetical protein
MMNLKGPEKSKSLAATTRSMFALPAKQATWGDAPPMFKCHDIFEVGVSAVNEASFISYIL